MRVVLVFIIALLIAGCGGSNSFTDKNSAIKGGEVISILSSEETKKLLQNSGFQTSNYKIFGTKRYKISYYTTDIHGDSVKASGVVVVPILDDSSISDRIRANGFATVIDCHGTIFLNDNAPSVALSNPNSYYGADVVFSTIGGFVTLMPDYVGFGDSKSSIHPYLLKKPSRNSIVDFTRAAFKFLEDNELGISVNEELYLSGYSEGGYVALASVKLLEQEGFNLKLSTPMAGPYLLEPIGSAIVNAEILPDATLGFVADLIYSYSTHSKEYNIKDIMREPYASILDNLFDKKHSNSQISTQLTTKVRGEDGLFTDSFLDDYNKSFFRIDLIDNSILNLETRTKIDLIHCLGDNVVPYEIAKNEKKLQSALGNNIDLITADTSEKKLDHIKCAVPAYKKALELFRESRKEVLGY